MTPRPWFGRERGELPEQAKTELLREMRRLGYLAPVVNILLDRAEELEQILVRQMTTKLLTDAETLAKFQAMQGAASEMALEAERLWTGAAPPLERDRTVNPRANGGANRLAQRTRI